MVTVRPGSKLYRDLYVIVPLSDGTRRWFDAQDIGDGFTAMNEKQKKTLFALGRGEFTIQLDDDGNPTFSMEKT